MLKFYQKNIFPYLLNKATGKNELIPYRQELLKQVSGDILEIGLGTGANLQYYPTHVNKITAIDPYLHKPAKSRLIIDFYAETIENNHFADNSFDSIVSTFTLCSTQDLALTLQEIRRILKPQGKLLFLEHGQATIKSHQQIQKLINPIYKIFACGCNLTRDYQKPLLAAGFSLQEYTIHKDMPFSPRCVVGNLFSGLAIKATPLGIANNIL